MSNDLNAIPDLESLARHQRVVVSDLSCLSVSGNNHAEGQFVHPLIGRDEFQRYISSEGRTRRLRLASVKCRRRFETQECEICVQGGCNTSNVSRGDPGWRVGTLPTNSLSFAVLLISTALIVSALKPLGIGPRFGRNLADTAGPAD